MDAPECEWRGDFEAIPQCAKAQSNWSPILLDFQEQAGINAEAGRRMVYDQAAPIPRHRARCQAMSQLGIHDVDKPMTPEDDSAKDGYGSAMVSIFLPCHSLKARTRCFNKDLG